MSEQITIRFPASGAPPAQLPAGAPLAEHLDAVNSPLLFGCRTGICGTCLVTVEGPAAPPDADEQELLDIFAEGDPSARLACQLICRGDLALTPHPEAP